LAGQKRNSYKQKEKLRGNMVFHKQTIGKIMSDTLVQKTAAMIQFPSGMLNNKATIDVLKRLLILAESGQLFGIAGVTFEIDEATGYFVIGEACESASDTIYELDKLRRRISNL
jgi:hypothetical protein